MTVLTRDERDEALAALPGWASDEGRGGMVQRFTFADFSEAFAFMTRVALEAEKADHHPEWSNVWNRVAILLSTHSAGGGTANDMQLAARIEAITGRG